MTMFNIGLGTKKVYSDKLVKQLNPYNVISSNLREDFEELNVSTVNFLSLSLARVESDQRKEDPNLDRLIHLFQQFYHLLNIDHIDLDHLSVIDIERIQNIYSQLKEINISDGMGLQLSELMNHYTRLILKLKISNCLILNTIEMKNRLVYWEDIRSSSNNKILYMIQISPIRVFHFCKKVITKSLNLFSEKRNDMLFTSSRPGTEEDHFIVHKLNDLKAFGLALKEVLLGSLNILAGRDPNFVFLKLSGNNFNKQVKYLLRSPTNLIDKEILSKIDIIKSKIESNTKSIDSLMNISDFSECVDRILEVDAAVKSSEANENEKIFNLLAKLQELEREEPLSETDKPSFIVRYWPILLLLIEYGPSTSKNIYVNRYEILEWIKFNFIDTVYGFYKNWVIKPVSNMLNTLRHDDGLAITSKESLRSDLDSLERMVIDFVADQKGGSVDRNELHKMIQNGDLTLLMSEYEQEIRRPLKSVVSGTLIRSLLIQIQKTKVDGALAMNGIDKLLKSQQLVFGVVSVSPSIFILYNVWKYLTTAKPISIGGKQLGIVCLRALNEIEHLLINSESEKNADGKLLVETINLILISTRLIPEQLSEEWAKDLNQLNNSAYSRDAKLRIISRLWNMYGPYFRQ